MSISNRFKAALRAGEWAAAAVMTEAHPDLGSRSDARGQTFVSYAMRDGRWGEAEWLLAHGANWTDALLGWLEGGLPANPLGERLLEVAKACHWDSEELVAVRGRLRECAIDAGRADMLALLSPRRGGLGLIAPSIAWAGWIAAISNFDKSVCDFLWDEDTAGGLVESQLSSLAAAAIGPGNIDALAWLVSKGMDVGQVGLDGRLLLVVAAKMGREELCSWLIERGADVETKDARGRTALYEAVAHGHDTCVRFLLSAGANPERRQGINNQGDSPLRLASKAGAREMRKVLSAGLEQRAVANAVSLAPAKTEPARRL